MKKLTLAVLIISVLILNTFVSGKDRPVDKLKFPELNEIRKPVIQKGELDNGIRIRLVSDSRFPLVNLTVYLKGGDVYEPSGKTGLASITAQLLRIGGVSDMSGDEIDRILDMNGISISFSSNSDDFIINVSSLKSGFTEALRILSRMLVSPAFDQGKFEEIKAQMSSSISRRNDDPGSIRSREFNKLIYGADSPFTAQLEYEHLDNITLDDVRKFYSMFFKPSNFLLGVTGPYEMDELQPVILKHLGSISGTAQIPGYPETEIPGHSFRVYFAEKENQTQSQIVVGHIGPKEDISEKARILVFNSIFSQGFNSRLMQRLRVKMGLTYGAGGGIDPEYLFPGDVSFTTFTKSESTLAAVNAIFDEIKRIRSEFVTDKELDEAKDYFLNSYVFKFSSPERILNNYLLQEFYGLDMEKYDNLVNDIKKVSAEDVLNTAKKYLDPEKMLILIVGTEKNIGDDLSLLGKMKKIDISIKSPQVKEKIPAATEESLKRGKDVISASLKRNYKGYVSAKTSVKEAVVTVETPNGKFNLDQKTFVVYPDKNYSETKVMGMTMTRVVNGEKGYMTQMGQRKELSAEEIYESRFGGMYDIFHFGAQYSFQYLKDETVNGKEYHIIYVTDNADKWAKFFVNKKNGLIEIIEKPENAAGQKDIGRTFLSEFKTHNNIQVPYRTEVFIKDKKVVDITVRNTMFNTEVDERLFEIEAKQ